MSRKHFLYKAQGFFFSSVESLAIELFKHLFWFEWPNLKVSGLSRYSFQSLTSFSVSIHSVALVCFIYYTSLHSPQWLEVETITYLRLTVRRKKRMKTKKTMTRQRSLHFRWNLSQDLKLLHNIIVGFWCKNYLFFFAHLFPSIHSFTY